MEIINVSTSNSYDVFVGVGILQNIGININNLLPGTRKIAVITDENVAKLYLTQLNQILETDYRIINYIVAPGEESKSFENFVAIQRWLSKNQVTGSDLIIAFGGGVIGDLAGFIASTYLRGINYIQIPTTLLAMVDSSVGGKTAIDMPEGKNLVGTFYQPKLVVCDISVLETLSEEVLNDGFSEVIKYGFIGNRELLGELLKDDYDIQNIVSTCIKMKRDIVEKDEFDAGTRKLLNFGHTTGHAIEQLSGYKISHGKAVAIGMYTDIAASVKSGGTSEEILETAEKLLMKFKLPKSTNYTTKEIYQASTTDKKIEGESITIIIPAKIGKCELRKITLKEYKNFLTEAIETKI